MPELISIVRESRERPREVVTQSDITEAGLLYLRSFKCAKVSLAAGAANSFPFTWQNPESNKIIVHEVIVRITTAGGTATAVLDIGAVANAAATGATIIDGLNLNATGVYSSHDVVAGGVGGNESPHVLDENGGATDWITGKCLVEKCDNLVGAVYIFYTEV